MNWLSRIARQIGADYLMLIFAGIGLARFLQYAWPTQELLKGQNPATVLDLLLIPVTFLAWLVYRPLSGSRRRFSVLILVVALNFSYQFLLVAARGELWNYSALLMPVSLVLVWLKPPSFRSVVRAADALSFMLIGISIAAQAAVRLDLIAGRTYVEHRYFGIELIDVLHWRWEGPFGYVNYAGSAGAFLLAYGLTRRGPLRPLFAGSGALMLLASESRGAAVAAFIGAAVWLLTRSHLPRARWASNLRWIAGLTAVGALTAGVYLFDRTLNGRTEIWSDYLGQWVGSVWLGVSQDHLLAAIAVGDVVPSGTTGHSFLVEMATRSGIFGAFLSIAAIWVVMLLAWKAYRAGMAAGLVVGVTWITVNLVDSLVSWLYLGVQLLPLLIAGLMSAAWLQSTDVTLLDGSADEMGKSAM